MVEALEFEVDGVELDPDEPRELGTVESALVAARAKSKYPDCPVCGESYSGTDFVWSGDMLFIHEGRDSTVSGCSVAVAGVAEIV